MDESDAKRILEQVSQALDNPYLRKAKRIVVAVVGGTVLLIGIAVWVLPGPAVVVIPRGLAILASEFVWARRWLRKARAWLPTHHGEKLSRKENQGDVSQD